MILAGTIGLDFGGLSIQCFLVRDNASAAEACVTSVRRSARFCFRDLADFFFIVCRGDLSDITALR